MDKIVVYTDGSSLVNGSDSSGCGWAYKMLLPKRKTKCGWGGCIGRTNNEVEMLAVIHALRDIRDKHVLVEVRTDSDYIVQTVSGLYGIHANRHLWAQLFAEKAKFDKIAFTWVRSHDKDRHNNEVDRMARKVAEYAQEVQDGKLN